MKLLYSIYKECKVLTRDRAGLAITFISVNESSVPLLLVDRDHDSLSHTLEKYIVNSKFFIVTKKQLSNEEVKQEIAKGHFFIGVIVPENTSKRLRERSTARIAKLLDSFSGDTTASHAPADTSKIRLN